MSVTGGTQGPIEGSSEETGREGTILVEAFNHEVRIPFDPLTGLPSGPRIHSPLEVVKFIDKSTPKLYQALTTGENLNPVVLKFYHIGPTLVEEHYYSIELENAIIVDIKQSNTNSEHISFTYQKIKWTWEIDGIASEDDWIVPPVP
ncbi:MAG: type VI secretion system tube protein Hcp [Planctomycetes bacterium]|nr:type VI secretion system tube protein Hcp [Planctomycetota bacterium]